MARSAPRFVRAASDSEAEAAQADFLDGRTPVRADWVIAVVFCAACFAVVSAFGVLALQRAAGPGLVVASKAPSEASFPATRWSASFEEGGR
jgi:hypothetical protein